MKSALSLKNPYLIRQQVFEKTLGLILKLSLEISIYIFIKGRKYHDFAAENHSPLWWLVESIFFWYCYSMFTYDLLEKGQNASSSRG